MDYGKERRIAGTRKRWHKMCGRIEKMWLFFFRQTHTKGSTNLNFPRRGLHRLKELCRCGGERLGRLESVRAEGCGGLGLALSLPALTKNENNQLLRS
jgi:hypothetical protein